MAVDIEGFDIVFSSANANHAREIDQSIARMSEKVPTLSIGLGEMAKALETLGKLNIDGVKKNLDAVKDSIENIDGSKLNKVFEIATSKSEGLLNSVTSLVNMLGKVDLSSFRGGAKTEIYDERSRVTTTRETGGESQNQEQINALIAQRETEMHRLIELQNTLNKATGEELSSSRQIFDLQEKLHQLKQELATIQGKLKSSQDFGLEPANVNWKQKQYEDSLKEIERYTQLVSKEEERIATHRLQIEQEIIDRKTAFQKAEEAYLKSVKSQRGQEGRFAIPQEGNAWRGVTIFSEKDPVRNLEWVQQELEKAIGKTKEYKQALNEMKSAMAQYFEIIRANPRNVGFDDYGTDILLSKIERINDQIRYGKNYDTGGELSALDAKKLEQQKKVLEDMLPIIEKFQLAAEGLKGAPSTTSVTGNLDNYKKQLKEAEEDAQQAKVSLDKLLEDAANYKNSRSPLLAEEKRLTEEVAKAEQQLLEAQNKVKSAQEAINKAEQEQKALGGEKRLAELKAETAELEKQKNLATQGGAPVQTAEKANAEQINALIAQREQKLQSLRIIEDGLVSAEANEVENAQKKLQLEQRELQIIEQQNGKKQEAITADKSTLTAIQGVVKEYDKAEKELEKMANKLGTAFQGAPQELQDYVFRTRQMLHNLVSDINASFSDPSQIQLLKGIKFPTEQIRAEFETLLKDLKVEAEAYFMNLWSNVQTNVGRGKGYTAKSVEPIGDNLDMDSRSYLSNAEEKLERMYLLLKHIRDYGNQPLFEGLQKDITNIAALDERIAVLDAQIEAVQKDVFSMPVSGEYGDVLTHRMQQLQNVRELLEHIRDAQSRDMVDGDVFAMNEQSLKERLEKRKQAVIEAEREAQKQVGTDWEEEARRELENRKKILADTQLAVSSLGLLGDHNEIKNAERQAASYKEMQERLAQNTKDKIAQLDREIAEEKQKLEVEKQQTNELEKQKALKQSDAKGTSSSGEVVISVKFDEKTVLSEIKNISDRLSALFKDIPVSLKKELDLTFFAEKANELKKMFDGITVDGIQPTPAKKTETTVSTPKLDAGSSRLSADSSLIIEAAFERMNNLTNAIIEKIRSVGNAENTLFTNLRTDIQGVTTALQGLVDQLSKVQEKSTRKKSTKKEDDAIVTEREVALTKEELARLDDINSKLAKSNDLLAKKRAEQDAIVKLRGTRDVFIDDEISRLETEIKAYNKAKQDLIVPKHGVAPSQSLVETEKAENAQLKLVKEVEEEANARQKNIAYLTQMISLIERMLKYGNLGHGVDMFSGMQQYLVDVQGKMKELLKEQRTTTEKQIANQDKANLDMAMSYLGMINEQIEAGKRKEREEQAYRERVLAAERAFYQERQKLYQSIFAEGGEQDKQKSIIEKAQQWYDNDAKKRLQAEEESHNAIQKLIAEADAQRKTAKEAEDRLNEQFYEKEKKRLYDLYQEQLNLKGKIGSLDNQRTIVSERSQGTITALSPKQEQLAQEYAKQLAKVNAEISKTASLVNYVDAQNAKESTRIALLEQEIKLQKELDKALEKIYAEQQKKSDAANAGLSASQIKSMENEYARLLVQIDKVNAARREMNEKQGAAWSTGNTQAFAQLSSGIQAADKELIRLNNRKAQLENESQLQLDKIRETHERKRGEQAVKDFEKAEREKTRIAEREAKKRADEEKKKIQDYKSQNLAQNTSLAGAAEFAKTANTINRLQTALKYLQDALSKTKPNTPEWNNANKVYQETKKRLDDIKKSMESVKTQTNSIIPNLKNLAMQFGLVFSVQQLNQWVKHMVEVRAQFELQNIALRSIIQNKEKADQIFAEVQQLALKSPFSIMQLNTYTKQMAAYGVEADKLVGTTKRLADVSAGLGVEMGRLILAYGQVKTANYLRATEVRQFTEAGLNITQELANYFTELNGKMVTAGEVTEMITKRMVKFEDVAEVFKRVTSAGGMFYEMQEKQSEGLQGQIQRIGDAYSIMLNDIGKSNQGTIAGVLATVRELIQNWRVVAEYIKAAASAYLLFKAYVHRGAILKVVTRLADAWNLVTKAIHSSTAATTFADFKNTDALGKQAMMLTGLGKLWSGATTAVRAFGIAIKAAFSATVILAVVQAVFSLINYFVEAKVKADQLAESLGNIDEEVSKEFNNSAAAYERLARAITDSSKTFDERNEAMSELKRTFKDILPDEYLQLSYIEQHAGHWNEAEKAMKQYYDSLALEKEKAAIQDANRSNINDAKKDIASTTIDDLGKDFGISEGQLQTFVDNILQQMLDGSITTTEQAVDEYIRQIENWNNKSLSKSQIDTLKENLNFDNSSFWNGTLFKKDMSDLLDIAKDMGAEFDNLAERQTHYASDSEKAQAEAEAMMKTRAAGAKELIERAKSGLDQINAIQRQLSQVDLEEQNEETQARKMQLQARLNEAIQQERDLYAAIGIEMPASFEQVAATTIDIREETARAAESIVKIFGDGIDPAVIDLYESYKKLEMVQSQLNDGTQRSQEEVAMLRDIERRSIDEIKSKYRQMGVSMQGDIKKVASSQQGIYTEMTRVCDATRNYFKKQLVDKLFGWIKTFGTTIEKFLAGIGVEVQFVDWDKLEAELKKNGGDLGKLMKDNVTSKVQPALDAHKQLLKSTLKINDKIINSDDRLVLKQGQTVKDYVKNLKTLKEENDKIISKYDKAKDKKQWLSLQDEEYNTEAKIQLLREQSKAAKEIAEAYDPTIFESKKKSGRKGADNTEEIARKRFEFIKRANTEYEKLLKNYDAETAKAKILADMMGEARALGVDKQFATDLFTKASTMDTLQSVYDTFYRGIVAKYPKIAIEFQKVFNGIALDVDVKLREEDRDGIKKQMDELMGGYELAIELDKSGVDRDIVSKLFGIDTFDLSDVTEGFEKAWLDALNERAKRAADATGDEFKAYKSLAEAKAKMGEEDVKLFESQQNKISDTFAKELRAREKEYAKYLKKSYSDSVNEQVNAYRKLRQLQLDADFKRNAIIGNDKLDDKQKQTALKELDAQSSQIAAKMQEQLQEKLNKIQWEGFKDSPLFETVLSDIENLGTATLDMLIKRLGDLKDTYKGLDPKNIKEIVKYIDQLTAQKIKNNPFKEWGNALREIHDLKKQGITLDKLNKNLVSDSDELTRLNAQIESYNKVLAIKQQMTHVTEQDVKLMQTDTQTLERQLRVLEEQKSKKSVSGVGVDGSDESKSLDLQIKKIQEILAARRTILASNRENIVLSAQELDLLKQSSNEITNRVLQLAKDKGLKEEDIETIKAQISSWDKLKDSQKEAIAILNEVGSAASAGFSVAESAIKLFGGSSDEVTSAMLQGFDDCIQSVISLTVAIVSFNTAANATAGIIGIIAAALTAVASLFNTIFNVHEAKLEESIKNHQRQVRKLEAEYNNLSDAISNAFSGFQLGTNTEAAIQNLEKQNEQYRAMIEDERDKKDTDEDKIADWEQAIADNLKKAQELRQRYLTELGGLGTGSDVRDAAESFVDAWAEAFGETRDGLSGLKEQFNDFMRNIVKKQAYMKIADHWINKFGDMINASFDKYGQVNYEKLQTAMKWFTEVAMPQMDSTLEDMNAFWERMGINLTGTTSSLSGLAAGIQGVTEETAQILEALLNSMRFYVADTNEQLKQIFNTMINPNEENPFLKELKNQTKYLASIDKRLDSVISATKRASGSHINVFTT